MYRTVLGPDLAGQTSVPSSSNMSDDHTRFRLEPKG